MLQRFCRGQRSDEPLFLTLNLNDDDIRVDRCAIDVARLCVLNVPGRLGQGADATARLDVSESSVAGPKRAGCIMSAPAESDCKAARARFERTSFRRTLLSTMLASRGFARTADSLC
jgi:hypothetical protein